MKRTFTLTIDLSEEMERKILEDCKEQQGFMEVLPEFLRPSETTWSIEEHLEMLLQLKLEETYK